MRLDSITLHSWSHKEVRIRSEEDWVLGFYQGDELVGPGIWVVPYEFRKVRDTGLASMIVDCYLKELLGIETPNEFDYACEILGACLPYML